MVAINKRPVRLLCSPGPPRGSRLRSFSPARIFLAPRTPSLFLSRVVSFPSVAVSASLPLPSLSEFPAVVISEPCEERASRRRKYFTSARKKEKSRTHFSPPPSPPPPSSSHRRPTPSSDRACQRHCRMHGKRGSGVRAIGEEEGREEG